MNYQIEELNFLTPRKKSKGTTFKLDHNGLYISMPIAENLGINTWRFIAWAELPNIKDAFVMIGYDTLEVVPPQLKPYLLYVQSVKQNDKVCAIKIQNRALTVLFPEGVIEAEIIEVNGNKAVLCKIITN